MSSSPNGHCTSHIAHPSSSVLVLVGPTASGKTTISLHLANQLNAEIISADSRQLFQFMNIGTAKPTPEERGNIKHYFVDELLPDQDFNASEFGSKGRLIVDDILRRKKVPLVVGGSGLYVRALADGFFEGPPPDPELRHHLYHRLKEEGAEKLLSELRHVDPVAAASMLPSNTRRIVRALEVYQLTGKPISELHKSKIEIPFTPIFVGLQWERAALYDRINKRSEWMIENGLLDEVKQLLESGYSPNLNALQTVGYKEAIDFLDGKISHERMVELIKQNSRRYAKRQLTWFRYDERIRWFEVQSEKEFKEIASRIGKYYREKVGVTGFEPATSWSRTKRSSRAEPHPE
jgi:tRNA dimethylallyltransferase